MPILLSPSSHCGLPILSEVAAVDSLRSVARLDASLEHGSTRMVRAYACRRLLLGQHGSLPGCEAMAALLLVRVRATGGAHPAWRWRRALGCTTSWNSGGGHWEQRNERRQHGEHVHALECMHRVCAAPFPARWEVEHGWSKKGVPPHALTKASDDERDQRYEGTTRWTLCASPLVSHALWLCAGAGVSRLVRPLLRIVRRKKASIRQIGRDDGNNTSELGRPTGTRTKRMRRTTNARRGEGHPTMHACASLTQKFESRLDTVWVGSRADERCDEEKDARMLQCKREKVVMERVSLRHASTPKEITRRICQRRDGSREDGEEKTSPKLLERGGT